MSASSISSVSHWQGLPAALGLALAPLVALGFTRFAYALLLPPMQIEFSWTFLQAGSLNTSNAVGYVAGALVAAWMGRRWGTLRTFTVSMVLSALALMATAWPSSLSLLLAVRAFGGVATAVAFVLGTALAANAMPGRAATSLSIYFAGSGLGIVLAGSLIPLAQASADALDWRQAWLLMGLVSIAASAIAWMAARASLRSSKPVTASDALPIWATLRPSLIANLLYGAGYVSYMTFMIALLKRLGFGVTLSKVFFVLIGGASMLASPFWGKLLGRMKTGQGFALVCVVVAVGTVPALIWSESWAVIASALIFGASFMAGPAAVSVAAQRLLPSSSLTWGLALLTAAFSLGRSIGPLMGGWLSDFTGSLSAGLWLGPALSLLGAASSLKQRSN